MIGASIRLFKKGQNILLLRQTDNLALATNDKSIANQIYGIIGAKIQLPGKIEPPFTYLGLVKDYNGVDVNQRR